MADSVSCLHVVASLHPQDGGPSRTVVQLTDALAGQSGIHAVLVSQGAPGRPTVASQTGGVERMICESSSRTALSFGLPVRSAIGRICNRRPPSIIHSHGVWLPVNHWASRGARRFRVPLVVQPRGMLEPWALRHRAARKRIAMALFQRRDLETAKILVATSQDEYVNFRRLGIEQPVAVIPNGIMFDDIDAHAPRADHDLRPRTVLFLSRVHPKKGLINLVHAWGRLRPENWRLRLAGPDEGGHLDEVMREARKLAVDSSIEYIGAVDDVAKSAAFHDADLFVLPTFSENFGLVVAEALAHGLPVITTRGAPWSDLETHGCGWWIDVGVDPLVLALRDAMAASEHERQAMGERGRVYVRRYDWQDIARQTADVYRWVLGKRPKPDCVQLD